MIKLSAILPHSPILIPNIGKKNSAILKKTANSFNKIQNEIIEKEVETIIIISPHRSGLKDISINNHFQFKISFEEFGDYFSKTRLYGNLILSYKLKEEAEPDFYPILKAENKPDYGSNIPLYLLLTKNNQLIKEFRGKIIIINTCAEKDLNYHFNFGKKIAQKLEEVDEKIAIIASAELSHCLNHNAPGGFYQKAVLFDEKTITALKKGPKGREDILKTDAKMALEAKECGLRPISLLLGIIDHLPYKAETLSYQKELGVGYLSMNINLNNKYKE